MRYKKIADELNIACEDVENVYISMLKMTEESRNINCGSCGFGSCEQMMAAITLDMRSKENCINFSLPEPQEVIFSQYSLAELANELAIQERLLRAKLTELSAAANKFNTHIQKLRSLSIDQPPT